MTSLTVWMKKQASTKLIRLMTFLIHLWILQVTREKKLRVLRGEYMAEIVYELEGLEKLDKELKYLSSHAVKVGVLWSGGSLKSNTDVQEYAIFNEYGTSKIPARPFFRLSVGTANAQNEIKEYMKSQVEQVIQGGMTGQQAYENLGTFVVQKIKKTIMSGNFAANDPKTVKAKGQSTPLIDTHSLFHSIDYEIVGV